MILNEYFFFFFDDEMIDPYDCLNKAQLSFEYLHTNSTTHTFLFGALAELVDNSRDADARNLHIYTGKDSSLRGGFYLTVLDDGCGMNYDDVFHVIVFGKSGKRRSLDSNQIGQYGNGLKSGAMRIANDLILFTKKENLGTCLFLSRTFHQEEHISQIICPMPCFDLSTEQPIENQEINGTRTYIPDPMKHELEMRIILKYSPFKTMEALFKQFQLITSSSGTLIVLYNLKLSDNGETELDIKTDPYDILIDSRNRQNLFDDHDDSTPLEYRSLRAYLSILYYEPRMRITIQERRVLTKKLPYTLYKPRQYQFKSTRFKARSEEELKKYETDLQVLEERIREADSQVYHLQQSMGVTLSIAERTKLRKAQINATELKDIATRLRNELTRKKSDMNTTKTLNFIFGLNIPNRSADGIFVYNCGRLIKMYEKIGQANKKTSYCRGVIGVVDIPSVVLEPTHNKQSFADEKEYHFLLKNMAEYMRQYCTDTNIERDLKDFWETYGYREDQLPSNDPEMVKRRQLAVPMLIQCDQCLKWRRLPYAGNDVVLTQSQLESWQCSDNTDLLNNSCSTNEKLEVILEGELKPKAQVRPTTRSISPFTRSSGPNKRLSNAEISSTTLNNIFEVTTRPMNTSKTSAAPPKKCRSPSSDSLPLKTKSRRKRKKICNANDKGNGKRSLARVSSSNSVTSKNKIHIVNDDDNTKNIDHIDDINDDPLPPPTIGARIWAMYQGARRSGRVLSVNDKRGVFKMRFDEFPRAEFDYLFTYKSSDWSYIGTPPPSVESNEALSNIAKKFKALIQFMLPPDWELTREQISSMSYDDLSQFDVHVFMRSYREKMSQMVEQRKIDEAHWRTSAQRFQTEVTDLLNISGMPIPNDCSMEDFQQHVQHYATQVDKLG